MITLLIYLLILILIFGVIWWVIDLIPLPPNFKNIARAIVALILLLGAAELSAADAAPAVALDARAFPMVDQPRECPDQGEGRDAWQDRQAEQAAHQDERGE